MSRIFTLIVASVLLVVLTSFFWIFQSGTIITTDMPDIIEAGAEVVVNVTISNVRSSGFVRYARYQQELPVGLTARSQNSANANFSFQDQTVRLIWMSVPESEELSFSYIITANERLTGSTNLGGQFSHIENNEPVLTNVNSRLLAISPSPHIEPDRRVNINEYAKIASIEAAAAGSGQTIALRQQPVWMEEDRSYLVSILVNRDAAQKYAKIEETIPAGYIASNLDSKGGIFSFRNQVASIIWMDLPAEPYFTVTYKLIPQESDMQATMNVTGLFTYMISDRTFTSDIIERRETLVGLNREQVNYILQNLHVPSEELPTLIAQTPSRPVENAITMPPQTEVTTAVTIPSRTTPATQPPVAATSNVGFILAPEDGIYYRVQLAAGHREVNIPRYFRNYRLDFDVMREDHEGWFKYTVGSFTEYREARDYRVHLGNTTTINDAFVTAYDHGRRITVQEALMALNQRWIR